jgi:DNA-binding CsgD family transcriptional regulator
MRQAELVEQIYECAFAPDLWSEALHQISCAVGAVGGYIAVRHRHYEIAGASAADARDWKWVLARGLIPAIASMSRPEFTVRELRARLVGAAAGFVPDHSILTRHDYEHPLFKDGLLPAGLKWGAATQFDAPWGMQVVVCFRRRSEEGPFDGENLQLLDSIKPHLERCAAISARLQLEQAQFATRFLSALDMPALVFDDAGQIVAFNDLVEARSDLFNWELRTLLAFCDPEADVALRVAVARWRDDDPLVFRSLPIRDANGAAAAVAHLVAMRRRPASLFARFWALVILTPVGPPPAPPFELVLSTFNLTPAEAKIAIGLAFGKAVEQIAADDNLSVNTVRAHVRGILRKTRTRRQADAMRLLAGLTLARA